MSGDRCASGTGSGVGALSRHRPGQPIVAVETQELEAATQTAPVPVAAVTDDVGGAPPRQPIGRLALVAACPTIAAAIMTGGLFVGAGGRIWAGVSGLLGILLAVRVRTIRRPAVLYVAIVGGVFAVGVIATA